MTASAPPTDGASHGPPPLPRGWKGRLKLLVFSLIPVAVLVVLAEWFASCSIVRYARTEPDSTGQRVYTMHMGKLPWSRVSRTPVNSQGFAEVEFASVGPKTPGCTHVVFTGDSFFFGDGVNRDSNIVELIRRSAPSRGTRCRRLFNLGERGTTIDMQLRRVRETMAQLQPDIVILGQYQNDLTDMTKPGGIALDTAKARAADSVRQWGDVQDRLSLYQMSLIKLLSYHVFSAMIQNNARRDVLKHWSVLADSSRRHDAERLMGLYEASYDSLVTELRARRIAFGVVIIPSKFDVLAGRYPEDAYFSELARERNVPALHLFPLMDSVRTPYAFLMYDGHLSEAGNRLVAGAIERWMYEAEPAPFPALRGTPVDSLRSGR